MDGTIIASTHHAYAQRKPGQRRAPPFPRELSPEYAQLSPLVAPFHSCLYLPSTLPHGISRSRISHCYGEYEPEARLQRPEPVHLTLFEALQRSTGNCYWELASWIALSPPADRNVASIRCCVRYYSLSSAGAPAFRTAPPSPTSLPVKSLIHHRHFDLLFTFTMTTALSNIRNAKPH